MAPQEPANSLDQVLEQAEIQFAEITNQNVRSIGNLGLVDVVNMLETKFEGSSNPDEQRKKAMTKEIISNVLTGLQFLNGLAAQAASTLLPNSNVCFNAVGMLLTIPKKIGDLHDAIGDLFAVINSYLVRFKILKRMEGQSGRLAQEMIDSTGAIMKCFVRLCARCYKAWSAKARLKLAFKAVFSDETTKVKGELQEFENLVKKQDGITNAITLETVLRTNLELSDVHNITQNITKIVVSLDRGIEGIARGVNSVNDKVDDLKDGVSSVVKDMTDKRMKEASEKDLKNLARLLDLGDDSGIAIREEQENILEHVAKDQMQGSGQWLNAIPSYRNWLDPVSVEHCLVLRGTVGCGKHYLACRIANEQAADQERYIVGYYRFTKAQSDARSKEQSHRLVAKALKTMAWQIATKNLPYKLELTRSCQSHDEIFGKGKQPTLEDLWHALGFATKSSKPSFTSILVFDGFEQLEPDIARSLVDVLSLKSPALSVATDMTRLRILIAGTDEIDGNARMRLVQHMPDIVVNSNNRSDIEAFIAKELRKPNFQTLNRLLETEDNLELNDAMHQTLPTIVAGGYFNVMNKFTRLEAAIESDGDESRIIEILREGLEEDRNHIAASTITDLNRDLSSREIKQLNVSLQWLVYAAGVCTIPMLEEAISLANLTRMSQLSSFADKVRSQEKFGRIITVRAEYGEEHAEIDKQIAQHLKHQSDNESNKKHTHISDITLTVTFNQATQAHVRALFQRLADATTGDLGHFASVEQAIDKDVISVDPDESYSSIVESALDVLTDEPDDDTRNIADWATFYLPDNLNANRLHKEGISHAISFRNKKKITRGIILLLSDVRLTLRHWSRSSWQTQVAWLADHEAVNIIDTWLHDDDVIRHLKPRYKRRLQQLLENDTARGGFWRPLTLEIARDWLLTDVKTFDDPEKWIDAFITMQRRSAVPALEQGPSQSNFPNDPLPGIRRTKTSIDEFHRPMLRRSGTEPIQADIGQDKAAAPAEHPQYEMSEHASTIPQPGQLTHTEHDDEKNTSTDPVQSMTSTDENIEDDADDELPWAARIARAAEWVREALSVTKLNATWYHRLAKTYDEWGETDEALRVLEEAIGLFPRTWKLHTLVSTLYKDQGMEKRALQPTLKAADILESDDEPDDNNSKRIQTYETLAEIQLSLGQIDDAEASVAKVLELEPENYSLRIKLLSSLAAHGRGVDVDEFITSTQNQPSRRNGLAELVNMFYQLSQYQWHSTPWGDLTLLIVTMRRCGFSKLASESIQAALAYSRGEEDPDEDQIAHLTILEANALALSSQTGDDDQKYIQRWQDAKAHYRQRGYNDLWHYWFTNQLLSSIYLGRAISETSSESVKESSAKRLEEIALEEASFSGRDNMSYFMRFKILEGQKESAKEHFASRMKDAFVWLSNDDTSDDWFGYKEMACIFEKINEDVNAATAWSLVGPESPSMTKADETEGSPTSVTSIDPEAEPQTPGERPRRAGKWGQICDGHCPKEWDFADDFVRCKICPETTFCRDCYKKLLSGCSDYYWCHPEHDFLDIPPWPVMDWPLGRTRVCIGGWAAYEQPGSEVVDIDVWLDRIRKDWNIEKSKEYDWKLSDAEEVVETAGTGEEQSDDSEGE